ncbi:MAG: hypothetical protein RL217_1601 [Pseudomonadota bacterium]|jgi:flagellar hook protein FlgE
MAFNIGLSGIRAASTDLEVTGNNIANASTTGFKKSRAEFGDVYTTTLLGTGSKPVGSGVMVENVRQEFSQGNIGDTGNVLDMAIDGNGFFVLNDQGTVSYSRAGMFTLDKNGYVVSNNKARLQGFQASTSGVINGVLGDIQILVSNQSPRLTNMVNAQYNLNAGAKVLQEQGQQLVSNGLVVGAPNSGIERSTTSILHSVAQPTNGGLPAQTVYGTGTLGVDTLADVAAAGYGPTAVTIDLGDGTGAHVVNLAGVTAGGTVQDVLNDVQNALNASLGTQQMRASQSPSGQLLLQRAGYHATDGSSFTISAGLDGIFGASVTSGGTNASPLFVGSNPLTADFRSVPGTHTTSRTSATPPLAIVASNPGARAVITGSSVYSPLNLTPPNALAFSIATQNGDLYPVNLSQGAWMGAAPGTWAAVTQTEIMNQINAQIIATAGAGNEEVTVVNNASRLEFRATLQADPGDYIQIAPNTVSSVNYTVDNIGFPSGNRYNAGMPPVQANNEFQLQVTSTTGHGSAAYTITIPPANYARLDDVAAAIQQQIDTYIGGSGLAGKVTVSAQSGQLVFTNTYVGQGEGIAISPTIAEPLAVAALGLNSLFTVSGTNQIDRSNSFRINLTVPAPDLEQRSGSVLISLNEEYRSVQQLAASINRQLNAQDADNYIGVQAFATETVPNVVPPQYRLELRATREGEASVISISNVTAAGPDVTEAQLFGILQADPINTGLLTTGIEGVSNMYPEQRVTITNPKGEATEVRIPARTEANEVVALFNMQPGVTATAETTATILRSSYNSPTRSMTMTLNGQALTATSLPDLVTEINSYRGTTLRGFSASLNEAGDLVIENQVGRDLRISINSPVATDSLVVQGAPNSGPVVLGGSTTADRSAAVGGVVTFVLNEGYTMSQPNPAISGLFGALTPDEFTPYTLNAFDPKDQDTYNHSSPTTMYDSLGNPHTMIQYFVKEPLDPTRPNEQNIWAMYVLIDGQDVGDPDPTLPFPQNLEPTRYRKELFFNQDGSLDAVGTGRMYITNWMPRDSQGNPTGAMGPVNVLEGGLPLAEPSTNSNFEMSLTGSTQHNGSFDINDKRQNGYGSGRLTSLEVDEEGVIFARFTNGQAQVLGQVALANFRNPEGLTPLGSTGWAESFESGNPTIGAPRTASFGKVRSNALEDSNVDLSDQLVRLIIAQRNYQASAKTIETTDQMTQTILNI